MSISRLAMIALIISSPALAQVGRVPAPCLVRCRQCSRAPPPSFSPHRSRRVRARFQLRARLDGVASVPTRPMRRAAHTIHRPQTIPATRTIRAIAAVKRQSGNEQRQPLVLSWRGRPPALHSGPSGGPMLSFGTMRASSVNQIYRVAVEHVRMRLSPDARGNFFSWWSYRRRRVRQSGRHSCGLSERDHHDTSPPNLARSCCQISPTSPLRARATKAGASETLIDLLSFNPKMPSDCGQWRNLPNAAPDAAPIKIVGQINQPQIY